MSNHFQKWMNSAPLGLTLIGLGLSVAMDAALKKGERRPWFAQGAIGLIIVNAGIALFGDAVKHRALYEWKTREKLNGGS